MMVQLGWVEHQLGMAMTWAYPNQVNGARFGADNPVARSMLLGGNYEAPDSQQLENQKGMVE